MGRLPLEQGRCTCPSCHKWPSQCQSFPERREDSHCGEALDGTQNTACSATTQSHLSVYVAISVNVIKVKRPLELFSQCSSQQYRQTHYKVLAAMKQHELGNANKEMSDILHKGRMTVSFFLFYLKLNGAVVCCVKSIEKVMCVHACICNTKNDCVKVSCSQKASQSSGRDLKTFYFTSVREELRVNVFESLLIHHTTWTFLWEQKKKRWIKVTLIIFNSGASSVSQHY